MNTTKGLAGENPAETVSKVLIADRSQAVRRAIRTLFIDNGFKTDNLIELASGYDVLYQLRNNKVGLIICEWEIPGLSGLELLSLVRGDSLHYSIPFIMLSSYNDQEHIMQAVSAGTNQYLVKPFSPNTLGKKLEPIISLLQKR